MTRAIAPLPTRLTLALTLALASATSQPAHAADPPATTTSSSSAPPPATPAAKQATPPASATPAPTAPANAGPTLPGSTGVAPPKIPAPAVVDNTDLVAPEAIGKPLARFELKLAGKTDDEEAQLQRHLADLIGKPLDDVVVGRAQLRLAAIRRYAKVKCLADESAVVTCDVIRARVLRDVHVVGLPLAILETDVMKRVFLKPGEPLDEDDTSGKSRLLRQRKRIEELLEREGFVGAQVRLIVKKAKLPGEFNVFIRVRGGSFPYVHRVILKGFAPLSQREIVEAYTRMCFTSEGLLDGAFIGNLTSCYNKRRLQDTTERFVTQLHELNYPEARIRVTTVFVDPARADDPACAVSQEDRDKYAAQGLKVPFECVDLIVDVTAGTRVTARFHNEDKKEKPIAKTPELLGSTWLWLRETFAEPVSRTLQLAAHAPPATALDTEVVEGRLKEQLSFQEAGAVDDTEVDVSAQNIEKYAGSRGRVAPKVDVEQAQYPGERVVDFSIAPSEIAAVRTVRFVGNVHITSEEIEKNTDLAARPRSLGNSGAVSREFLDDDEQKLRTLYASHGYPEANVQAVAAVATPGDIDVTFIIDEGAPFVLHGLVLAGGAPAITPDVLKAIKHCDGGLATKEKRAPKEPADCVGAPLRPEELEADAQRVQQVYASHGYSNVDVDVDTAFETEGPTVRVRVVPHNASDLERKDPQTNNVQQVTLGEVFLEGNYVTRRDVMLREAGLDGKAGQPLDPVTLGKGISRLRRSGLFDSVELQYLGLDGSFGTDRAGIRLSVDERPAFTVDTSAGFSTEQFVSLRTEVRHKNVFGTMLDADWLLDFGLFVGRFSQTKAQIRWPRIFGTDVSASFVPLAISYLDAPSGARLSTPSTTAGQKAQAEWNAPDLRRRLFSAGASLSLDWRFHDIHPLLDDKLTLGIALEFRYDWLDPAGAPVTPLSVEALRTVDGVLEVLNVAPTRVATLTPRVSYNDIDNPFDPKNGYGIDVFVRGSTPPFVTHGPFGVFGAAARGYHTFFDRLTVAAGGRTRLGGSNTTKCPGQAFGCEWALMQSDLLLLGGERSVRGVDENTIGVTSPIYDAQLKPILAAGHQLIAPRPGLIGANVNLELRYLLVKQFFIGSLQPAIFSDAGVSTDDLGLNPFPAANEPIDTRIAWSFGTGLRLVTPVGPLSADVAWSPPRGGPLKFYLTLGYVF